MTFKKQLKYQIESLERDIELYKRNKRGTVVMERHLHDLQKQLDFLERD